MGKTDESNWHSQWIGRCVGFIPRTIFHKEESGNLRPPRDVIFFHDWEKPDHAMWRSIDELQAKPIMTPAEEYDRRNVVGRYNWIRWAVGQTHFPGYNHLPEADAEMLAFIKTLGPEYEGVGTTGKMDMKPPEGSWQSVILDWHLKFWASQPSKPEPELLVTTAAGGS